MTLRITETEHDHIPEEFSIEDLKKADFTEEEIKLLSEGDDPVVQAEGRAGEEEQQAKAVHNPNPESDPAIGKDNDTEAQSALEAEAAKAQGASTDGDGEGEVVGFQETPDPEPVNIPDTSAYEARVAEINEELGGLLGRYNDGDLTEDEVSELQQNLIKEQVAAQTAISNAESLAQSAVDQATEHWFSRLDAYKELAPELFDEDTHRPAWDAKLRMVTGSEEYTDLTRDGQIRMAHKLYAAEYEARNGSALDIPVPTSKAAAKVEEQAPKQKEVRTDPKPEAPQTLSGINSDSDQEVQDSTFAAIDRIGLEDPERAEEMVAELSPKLYEQYLAGQ